MFIYKIYAKTYKNVSQSVISSDLKEDRQKAAIMQTLDRLLSISVRCALVDLLCLCVAFFFFCSWICMMSQRADISNMVI